MEKMMAKYIDVEPLVKEISDFKKAVNSANTDYLTGYLSALSVVQGMIAGQPTANVVSKETHEAVVKALQAMAETDVVPVVRCKNCCCSEEYTAADGKTYYTCDELQLAGLEPDDFCSYGERKTDNE